MHLHHALAPHGASIAGAGAFEDLFKARNTNFFRPFKHAFFKILCRKNSGGVETHHKHGGTEFAEIDVGLMLFDTLAVPGNEFFNFIRVGEFKLFRISPTGNGFQIFRSHHSPHAGPPVGMAAFVHDIGNQNHPLAGRPNGCDACFGFIDLFSDPVQGISVFKSPDGGSIPDFHHTGVDPKIDRLQCFAFDNDGIIAGKFEFGTEIATGFRFGKSSRQGRLRSNCVATESGQGCPRDHRKCDNQNIVRPQRVGAGFQILQQVVSAEPSPADISPVKVF